MFNWIKNLFSRLKSWIKSIYPKKKIDPNIFSCGLFKAKMSDIKEIERQRKHINHMTDCLVGDVPVQDQLTVLEGHYKAQDDMNAEADRVQKEYMNRLSKVKKFDGPGDKILKEHNTNG